MADFDCIHQLANELKQLEGVQRQDPELGKETTDYFYSKYTNRLFGAPYQLLPSVDARFAETNINVGNEYLRNFILNSPILEIKAGIPMYTYKQSFIDKLAAKKVAGKEYTWSDILKDVYSKITDIEPEARMFTFANRYIEYMAHVNYMCRSMAYLLNLELPEPKEGEQSKTSSVYPPGIHLDKDSITKYKEARWEYYRMIFKKSEETKESEESQNEIGGQSWGTSIKRWFVNNILPNWLSKSLGAAGWLDIGDLREGIDRELDYGTKFLVEPVSPSETLTNEIGNSAIADAINGLYSNIGNEVAFLNDSQTFNGIASGALKALYQSGTAALETVTQMIGNGLGENYIASLAAGGIRNLAGYKMIYPQIYKSSNYKTSYSFVVHLNSPYGDVYNYYMNIVVPLMHLICLASPRLVSGNGMKAPYMVQAYIPGMCTIDMGIITSMRIVKNKSSSHVSVDGFPLDVDVEFTIEELYNSLPISSAMAPESFLTNESLNNYMCNMAGLRPSHDAKDKILSLGSEAFETYRKYWGEYYKEYLATGQRGSGGESGTSTSDKSKDKSKDTSKK